MPTEKPRYSITVDDEMLQEIEYFRYINRLSTKSAATVELIKIGLREIKRNPSGTIDIKESESLYDRLKSQIPKDSDESTSDREAGAR